MSIAGVPLSKEKTEGQSSCLSFLGLDIDTVNQSIFVPSDKVVELQEHIMEVQDKKKTTLQSLAGSLAFITSCQLEGLFHVVCMVYKYLRVLTVHLILILLGCLGKLNMTCRCG